METVYVAQGANSYFDQRKDYTELRDKLAASGDKQGLTHATQAWRYWESQFLAQHPTFAEDLKSGDREIRAGQALTELRTVFDRGLAPASEQTSRVKSLLNDYDDYSLAYRQASAQGDRQATSKLYKTWQAYMAFTVQKDPAAKQVVSAVFARLPRPVVNPEEDFNLE